MKTIPLLIILSVFSASFVEAQLLQDTVQKKGARMIEFYEYCLDSSAHNRLFIFLVDHGSHVAFTNHQFNKAFIPLIKPVQVITRPEPKRHGELVYDFLYRSMVDTPYSFNNFMQHNLAVNVYSTIGGLPVTWQFNTRQSNVPFLRNYSSVGVQFDADTYREQLKEKIRDSYVQRLASLASDTAILQRLKNGQAEADELGRWLRDDRQVQQLINYQQQLKNINAGQLQSLATQLPSDSVKQKLSNLTGEATDITSRAGRLSNIKEEGLARGQQLMSRGNVEKIAEKLIAPKTGGDSTSDSLKVAGNSSSLSQRKQLAQDSLMKVKRRMEAFIKTYNDKKQRYDSIMTRVAFLRRTYSSVTGTYKQKLDSLQKGLIPLDNSDSLLARLKDDSSYAAKYKWYRFMLSVRKVAIGRSMVDYSDLSVKNVAVNGINVEYGNKVYLAFAAGFLDYRFRDFIIQQAGAPKQYFAAAKAGIGGPEKNNMVLTAYTGRKQASYYTTANIPAVNNVSGITLSGKYYIERNTYLVAEIAKSSYPGLITNAGTPGTTLHRTFSLSDHSNEAYSLQLFSFIEPTGTRLYGQYKRTGNNFQSFNVYNTNTAGVSWQLRADQYFFRRKLYITGAVKKNEYNTPYLVSNYKSDYVFKSIQATLRIKKWPSLSIGYMPSSQLTNINNQIAEYRFNTLTANSSYTFSAGKKYISTTMLYTRFFNSSDEQNFIFYNAKSIYINNSIFGTKVGFNTSLGSTSNNNYRLLTAEEGVNASPWKNFSCGAGLKYSSMNSTDNRSGWFGNMRFNAGRRIGEFSFYYDSGYLPGTGGRLVKSDFGRVVYTKIF